ncbi:flagellar basal-body MS-ring/collar protein FliF [Parapusillimonas granuli]|uniref:Flagellar M-ring protein n=1 Tax=Parapusillimonas granuli TaxID=380911 RepID=A0A853G3J1_9BURK|nr:flagellar basal-body MS-ring/collar protein FliF [Parapusillimonas granuli]MBB5213373.1 flagellar M-ring protein FliF [Parapusillimonas granuli]MEB2398473.1 flagellar basal-body MS-ring/collar protein FliF [Alcaligenaceae bacterium]NYT51928.1 flagellar M-ring protein FliF [Parapusillimonas granuli]
MSQTAQLLARFPVLARIGGLPKPALMGGAAAIIAVLVVLALWSRGPDYKVLFSNIEDRDGGAIVTALAQMNVPYKLSGTGNAILVPADKVHEVRLQLAQQGLPRGGEAGFELLDQTRFGASQFTEQVNYQRALEGELVSSIQALHAVQSARVHLAIPRESLFVRDRQPPTASVLLTLYPGRTLSDAQVAAITWLVSSSVPHLTAEKVSVVDQNGRLLTSPTGDAGLDSTRRNLVNEIEQRTVGRILTLLNPLMGSGNVRAQVSADVDFAQREQTSEVYRPNQKPGEAAVRSEQTSASLQNGVLPPQGVPGALTNQPPGNPTAPIQVPPQGGAQQDGAAPNAQPAAGNNAPATVGTAGAAPAQQTGTSRNDATINYEVDRTISHVKDQLGSLRRLSVAVVVNYRNNADGEPEALPEGELEKINELVKQAMGYSSERGDTVSVINSPFSDDTPPAPPIWENPVYLNYSLQLIQYLLIALALFIVWRSIIKPMLDNNAQARLDREAEKAEEERNREQMADAERLAAEMSRYEDNLTTARNMALKDPRAVAMVLRSWMDKKDGNR